MIGKLIAGLLGGIVVGVFGSLLAVFAVPEAVATQDVVTPVALVGFGVVAFILAVTAQRTAKAWRRILILTALLCFAMPLAAVLFTGSQISQISAQTGNDGASIAGTALGGGMFSVLTGFVGLFLGAIFLVIGLLVGRDKQIVYVER